MVNEKVTLLVRYLFIFKIVEPVFTFGYVSMMLSPTTVSSVQPETRSVGASSMFKVRYAKNNVKLLPSV